MGLRISIITVCFNSASTIRETLESVFGQTYAHVEYLIIDGGSTDETLQIVANYQHQLSSIISEPDKGIYDAMNKGIQMASGEVIGLLNSDDVYVYPEYLDDVARIFAESNADVVYADLLYVTPDNQRIVRKWRSGSYKKGSFRRGWMPPHPTVFLKKSVYDKVGLFNISLKSAADYELMLRVFEKHDFNIAYLPKYGVRMRTGGVSNASLKNRLFANREDALAWEMNGMKPLPYTRYLKPLRKLSQLLILPTKNP